jgi:cellulose synthase/poly-beta-1,6-N-acetylglucosamine synthase-like glycosyltransferase
MLDMQRPAADVVIPFAGPEDELRELAAAAARLELREGDTLTIVDNRADGSDDERDGIRILAAPELQTSYFARNRGARAGSNPWLVFIDADVEPVVDLVDRYIADGVAEGVAVLVGAVVDEPVSGSATPAARYSMLKGGMGQENTFGSQRRPYAQTANCAVRRSAFEAVGGFRERVRSGGDADLCWRLGEAGWSLEGREQAQVVHRSRRSLRKLLRQRARHGSGAAWLDREHPGAFPRPRWPGLAKWTAQSLLRAAGARLAGRSDEALLLSIEPLSEWAFELGRLFPNEVRR